MNRRTAIGTLTAFGLFAAFGLAQSESPAPQILTISGDVPSPLQLKADDLAKMPRETVSVQEEDGTKVQYEGVPLREVLARAGAPLGKELRGKALASYVLAKAHDGYQVVFGKRPDAASSTRGSTGRRTSLPASATRERIS
jgi:hypothetical protein